MPLAFNPQSGEAMYLTKDGQWAPAQMAVNPTTKEKLAFDGSEWKPLPQRNKGALGYADDVVRSIASGATFGFADEIAAKMDELIGRGSYEENIGRERARDAEIPASVSVPGEVAGAVMSALASAPLRASLAAASGFSALPQTARFILGGAGSGAMFGAGHAEEGSRLGGAAAGAGVGAAAGYVAPKALQGLNALGGGIRRAFSSKDRALADLNRAALRDSTTPQQLAQQMTATHQSIPEATLADVGGENVRGLVERIAQTPGAGRSIVVPALEQRQRTQMSRISFDLSRLAGTHRTATQAVTETMAERSAAAKPLYQQAMDFNARAVPEVVQAWENATQTGWGQSILKSASLRRTLQTEYGIRDAKDAPLMVLIDAWKKEVDGQIGEAIRAGNGRLSQVLSGMRDRVIPVIDQHNPAYQSARNAWAGPSQYLEAIDQGRKLLTNRVTAEELPSLIARMSDAEREAYRIGAVASIVAKMGNDPARMADMTKYLRSPEVRAKITAILPDDAARAAWTQRLEHEVNSSALVGRSLGNSSTPRRLAEQNDAGDVVVDLVLDTFQGAPASILRRLFNATIGSARDTMRSRTDHILADTLLDSKGSALQRLITASPSRPASSNFTPAAINAANSIFAGSQ